MKMLLVFLLIAVSPIAAYAQSNDRFDQLLTSIDTLPNKADLEQFTDVQQRLKEVVADNNRSNYERARALGFLMHWPEAHRPLLLKQTDPTLVKTALFALTQFYGSSLNTNELTFLKRHIQNDEKSVRWVAVKAINTLPDQVAVSLLNNAVTSIDPAIAKWSRKQIELRQIVE